MSSTTGLLMRSAEDAETPPQAIGSTIVVEADSAQHRYPRFSLGPMSWRLDPGARTALVGANGAGKTTLLSMLAGQLAPTGGVIRVGGINVATDPIAVRRQVAFVADRLLCCPWLTVTQHFRLQARFYPEWRMSVAVGTAESLGLDVSHELQSLSRGNSLKVALCSAFAQGARLLLLDEPTAGLDPVARIEFLRLLKREVAMRQELSVVLATHILEDLEDLDATDLIVLRAGEAQHTDLSTSARGESVSALARRELLILS